jgi:signal transduction histidine kinase
MLKRNLLYGVVILISLLLIVNIFFTHFNNQIIQRNKELQQEAENIKLYTEQIGKSTIHGLDIGLRGYVIIRNSQFFSPVDSAILRKDSILNNVESRLIKQNYDLTEFNLLRDSLDSYISFCLHLKDLLAEGKDEQFKTEFSSDKGLDLWIQYLRFLKNIGEFEDKINSEAEQEYQAALQRNYLLQIFLFLICCPTLIYTAIRTRRNVNLSEQLHQLEADKNKLLTAQNFQLELMVADRTKEIALQNEEITSQKEEISAQRDTLAQQNITLHEIHRLLEQQNKSIENKNEQLEVEVLNRTLELQRANKELIDHNNQLEQFAFVSAHSLRSPVASILGLANLIKMTNDQDEKEEALHLLVQSTYNLDEVISELNAILEIRDQSSNFTAVNLEDCYSRAMITLERIYKETSAVVNTDFTCCKTVFGLSQYVESILYQLLSNALKYRQPDRTPEVSIKTYRKEPFICLEISDNGLGIDLNQHQQNMFTLYKRFHSHTKGKGLGLYLVKTQMVAMEGKVEVHSIPEEGTTFYLYFKPVSAA